MLVFLGPWEWKAFGLQRPMGSHFQSSSNVEIVLIRLTAISVVV